MACIGCMVGAVGFATLWSSGKLVELVSEARRNAAMRRAARELALAAERTQAPLFDEVPDTGLESSPERRGTANPEQGVAGLRRTALDPNPT